MSYANSVRAAVDDHPRNLALAVRPLIARPVGCWLHDSGQGMFVLPVL